ncbi:MAG: hypothetical protein R3E08_15195 [Thiotrichaceae bacterium]
MWNFHFSLHRYFTLSIDAVVQGTANGLRYLRVGGRGECLKIQLTYAYSDARFVGWLFTHQSFDLKNNIQCISRSHYDIFFWSKNRRYFMCLHHFILYRNQDLNEIVPDVVQHL